MLEILKKISLGEKSEFDYEDWKSWTPEKWIKWSNSKEYKEKYLNVLNPYKVEKEEFPFKTYEDLDGPVLDYRDSQPIILTEFDINRFKDDKKVIDEGKEDQIDVEDYDFLREGDKLRRDH